MTPEVNKEWACTMLRQKNTTLGRLPKKDDFDEATRSRIKAFLGPWPRALEAAGLKEAKAKMPISNTKKKANTKPGNQRTAPLQKSDCIRRRNGDDK